MSAHSELPDVIARTIDALADLVPAADRPALAALMTHSAAPTDGLAFALAARLCPPPLNADNAMQSAVAWLSAARHQTSEDAKQSCLASALGMPAGPALLRASRWLIRLTPTVDALRPLWRRCAHDQESSESR